MIWGNCKVSDDDDQKLGYPDNLSADPLSYTIFHQNLFSNFGDEACWWMNTQHTHHSFFAFCIKNAQKLCSTFFFQESKIDRHLKILAPGCQKYNYMSPVFTISHILIFEYRDGKVMEWSICSVPNMRHAGISLFSWKPEENESNLNEWKLTDLRL